VHAGTNLMNSYGDFMSGVDTLESASHFQLVSGILQPGQVKTAGWICFGLAALIGLYLATIRGWPVIASGGLGVLCGYCYTMGPKPYKYLGLGPIAIFFLMGPCMVWPAYFIQTAQFSWFPVWASLPICFLISGIHHSNDLRDMQYDGKAGITTLALILGRKTSMQLFHLLFLGAFLSTAGLIITEYLPWTAALPLLLCPAALKMLVKSRKFFWLEQDHIGSLESMAAGFHFKFGILLILGTCLHPLISRFIPAG